MQVKNNVIPEIGYKPGNGWEQPETANIKVTDNFATLLQEDFDKLKEYSTSTPTGAYSGKMWKANERGTDNWLLCWYRPADGAQGMMGYTTIETRKIILQDLIDLIDVNLTSE